MFRPSLLLHVGVACWVTLLAAAPSAAETSLAKSAGALECAEPSDCRLREVAATHGIRIGLFDSLGNEQREQIVIAEANSYTNHAFSWNVIQPAPDVWNFAPADAGYAFAQKHGFHMTALHFAWDQQFLDDLPDWVLEIEDAEALRAVVRDRARVIFARYPGLDRIDVINEPLHVSQGHLYPNHFHTVLGDDYVQELFEIVGEEAPPGVELFVNENFVEYFAPKAAGLVALVRELVDAGAPIHAVGLQTHLLFGEPDWALFESTLRQLADLGVAVFLSEVDVPVEVDLEDRFTVQAERYQRVVETCLAVPACDEITVWGVDDPSTWLEWFWGMGLDPLLYDESFQRKPAYEAVRSALVAPEPSSAVLALAAQTTVAAIAVLRRRARAGALAAQR